MIHKFKYFVFILAIAAGVITGLLGSSSRALALSGNDFVAGRIMDDSIFFNPSTMNLSDIQAVLNAKVPVCDTNGTQPYAGTTRAAYGASKGYPAPYICLKDYTQSVQGSSADSYCGGSVSAGTKSAGQIIYDVSQACGVNPKVLIVLLQKEQALVTDDWPWPIQYQGATGYGCPDTAACDSQYYGFFNQVYNAARQFQRYVKQSNLFNYVSGQSSFVQYNPNSACGGGNLFMQNQATAGLYNYTPYQPNQAALSNLYGSGDSCSAYGNRNFWRLYIDWFGSPTSSTPYAWAYEGQQAYSDSARTKLFTSVPTVAPGASYYMRLKARNMGTETWSPSFLHLGTSRPNDRTSQFADSSWAPYQGVPRPAQMSESSLSPGQIGTFDFILKAPNTPGSYAEYFNLVADGRTWLNDPGFSFTVNVVNPVGASNSTNTGLASGATLNKGGFLLSPDSQSVLAIQRDGNLSLLSNFGSVWNTGALGANVDRLVMQSDGNLVLYSTSGQPLWSAQTSGNPGAWLALQTDGNMVVYSSSNVALWSTSTILSPDHLAYVNTTLSSGGLLYPGQKIETADRGFKLILQTDGNLVLYSPTRALWATGTDGKQVAFLAMQGDGNLVLYDSSYRPLWSSRTAGYGPLRLVTQGDGNLVLYNRFNIPYWNTETAGAQ